MEGCSKRSADAVPVLPDDPLVEILSRVPAKSVCRFKCVSKDWRDLIDDPDNRKKLPQAMQGLFVKTGDKFRGISFSYIDLIVRSVPLDIDPSFSFVTETTRINFFFSDSCNGLVLFGHCQEPSHESPSDYIVCNPTTKQWLDVPACGSRAAVSHTYLAFDPAVSSHFHLVQFQMPDENKDVESLHVYSSKTGTWSQNQIDEQKEQGQLEGWHHQFALDHDLDHQCALVNGFLHLIVWGLHGRHILAVDVQGKARRMIDVPRMADVRPGSSFVCYLGQSQGHLHCVTKKYTDETNDSKLSTWVIRDYDTQQWVLKNTVDLNSLGFLDFEVVDIHQDCNVLFFLEESCKLYAYDMDRKELSAIATFKDTKTPWDFNRYVTYFSESPDLTNKY